MQKKIHAKSNRCPNQWVRLPNRATVAVAAASKGIHQQRFAVSICHCE